MPTKNIHLEAKNIYHNEKCTKNDIFRNESETPFPELLPINYLFQNYILHLLAYTGILFSSLKLNKSHEEKKDYELNINITSISSTSSSSSILFLFKKRYTKN